MCLRADAQRPTGRAARHDAAAHGGPHRHAGDKPHADARADSGPRDGDGHEQRHQGRAADQRPDDLGRQRRKDAGRAENAVCRLRPDAGREGGLPLPAGGQQRRRRGHGLRRGFCHKKVRCAVHGDGVQRRHGHPHRVFFYPGGLQLAAADGPELRPVRDPHL